jgi:hypothetical protein
VAGFNREEKKIIREGDGEYILYTICYCTSLGFPRVYVVFTIPYTRLGLYIFFYLYMIIQNTEYTVYSLCLSVFPSLNLTWYQSQINFLAL